MSSPRGCLVCLAARRGGELSGSGPSGGRRPSTALGSIQFQVLRWFLAISGAGWRGYDPQRVTGLYPTEVATDYAFVGFGGGEFKCLGDQFAMMESTVMLALLIQRPFRAFLRHYIE